jgi:hypothetical protein
VEAITEDTFAQTLVIFTIPTNMGELIKIMQVVLLQQGEVNKGLLLTLIEAFGARTMKGRQFQESHQD